MTDNMDDNPDQVIRLAARGDGVTGDGRYVAGAAPGDMLRADGGLERGAHYQKPLCRHFEQCGGCSLQHIDEASLAQFVEESCLYPLKNKNIVPENVHPVHLSPVGGRRRVSMRFNRHGKKLTIGFNSKGTHRIIAIEQCPVMHPVLLQLALALRPVLKNWPIEKLSGTLDMALVLSDGQEKADILLTGLSLADADLPVQEELLAFAKSHHLARLAIDDGFGAQVIWEPEPVMMGFGQYHSGFVQKGFLQATKDGEQALANAAISAMQGCEKIADLFCGLGCFGYYLLGDHAPKTRKIYAAEAAREPILTLKNHAGRLQLPIFADHRDLYRNPLRPEELNRFDGVVIDPPRAGAKEQFKQLALAHVPKICAISCNPSTFARDALILTEAGYRLTDLWPVGQFRWFTHVELASLFVKNPE